ncbi:MAG: tRNA1(Val) (adenine(37)-N6)-methyltransferase [Bacteroidota bacterium]
MSENTFRFRQFTVHQEKCAMKVGTDAVLLGSWVKPGPSMRVLDIGTGTGIIALMIAQKSIADIDAIDIDEGAYAQAKENFRISPWFERLDIRQISLQEYVEVCDKKYDLIISNPPYFHHASKPQEEARTTARHSDALSFSDLIKGVKNLLSVEGKFCVVLPFKEGMEFMDLAQSSGLFCHRLARVKTVADKPEKRLLMEFNRHFGLLTEEEIVIQEDDHQFSRQYVELTKEYYIQLKPTPPLAP